MYPMERHPAAAKYSDGKTKEKTKAETGTAISLAAAFLPDKAACSQASGIAIAIGIKADQIKPPHDAPKAKRVILLSPEYECFPLWAPTFADAGNISPDDLKISSALRKEILRWDAIHQLTYNRDDPPNSHPMRIDQAEFDRRGIRIVERLREELGSDFEVSSR